MAYASVCYITQWPVCDKYAQMFNKKFLPYEIKHAIIHKISIIQIYEIGHPAK